VILDRIVLKNFGVYAGRQELVLTPPSSDQPVVLVGAMNGAGKTTLLDALQLAFYGPAASCSGRGKLAYRDYLAEMIHRGVEQSEGAGIEVHFRRTVEGRMQNISIARSWRDAGRGVEEFVSASRNDEPDAILGEHWAEYIENYLPVRLASLFFFDGEQITTMAEDEHAAGLLETGLHALLGLDLVERLHADLDVLARRKQTAAAGTEAGQRLGAFEDEAKKAELVHREAKQESAFLRAHLLHLQNVELKEALYRFRKEGGDLFERREAFAAERAEAAKNLHECESDLRTLAAGPAPLLLIEDLLTETADQAVREVEAERNRVLADAESERDRRVLADLKRKRVAAVTLEMIDRVLAEHRPERDTKTIVILQPTAEFMDDLRRVRESDLPTARKRADELLRTVEGARERLARLDERLSAVPAADAIAKSQAAILDVEQRISETETKLRIAEEKERTARVESEQRERAYKQALTAAAEAGTGHEDNRRILTRIPKVQATLTALREKVIARRIRTFERLIFESFQLLLRKRALVTGLRIDPSDYRIELAGADGKPLPFRRLSAGERQLLATAILWGLAKASGRPVPTIIDTPLGRLDSSHRGHLVERYFPAASHQVMLLSTDKEIEADYYVKLRPFIGREYLLVGDEAKQMTTIREGYFNSP
jgi:DNA sulfur modification protein DndD